MIQFSGIPATELSALKSAGITDKDLRDSISILCFPKEQWKCPLCKLSIMFYIDRYGNWMGRKTKTSQIVKALYDSLDKDAQRDVMKYLMESEDDED